MSLVPVGCVLPSAADASHPLQQAWRELDVPQCGYCQPGILMSAASLLNDNPSPSDAEIDAGITNICRCGTFISNGGVEQTNFDTYRSMLIGEMPKVEVILMPSGGFWGGIGEPTIAVAAPAVLNAIFAATGKRIRRFPLSGVDLRAA